MAMRDKAVMGGRFAPVARARRLLGALRFAVKTFQKFRMPKMKMGVTLEKILPRAEQGVQNGFFYSVVSASRREHGQSWLHKFRHPNK